MDVNPMNAQCLPAGHVLDACTITDVHAMDSQGIVYLAEAAEGEKALLRECFPQLTAVRTGEDVQLPSTAKARFLEIAAALAQSSQPFIPKICSFEAHGTAYCLTTYPASVQHFTIGADAPCTPAYIQSLGIRLCDIADHLLSLGLTLGSLSADSFLTGEQGAFYLNVQRIFEASVRTPDSAAVTEEIRAFLAGLCEHAASEPLAAAPVLPLLQETLQQNWQQPQALREALICAAGEVRPQKKRAKFPLARTLVCAGFLAAGLAACGYFVKQGLSLQQKVQLGLVQPDVIAVWMPLEGTLDPDAQQQLYEQLASSFERKYPGFGVDIYLMDDAFFQEALAEERDTDLPRPVVVMHASEELAELHGISLEPLTEALPSVYSVCMQDFERYVPLGYTMPALFWNPYRAEGELDSYLISGKLEGETIEFADLSSDIPCDASIASLLYAEDPKRPPFEEQSFTYFLESPDPAPMLASTEKLARIQAMPELSGVVEMYPITVNGHHPIQFERLCYVDHEADANSADIGMLWIQYLLTEEAQQNLFVEQYGCFPIHGDATRNMAADHEAFDWLQEGDGE